MKELILVRHGQSEQHIRDITGGWTDARLTELGCRQAQSTAERLALKMKEDSVRILSSDLSRARQTARIIGKPVGVEPTFHRELRELNNGTAAGLTQAQAKEIALPVTHPMIDWIPYPQAESWRMMTDRVFDFMERVEAGIEEIAVVVTHGNSGIAVIQWWLRMAEACRKGISFELDACSITWLNINSWGERTIVKLNDTSHLER
ncbi:MAG: histidine phosphatase family protein [Phycisphaerae bacterium]|nr:histidine phosphatase family protein [Phycisphaerae bacterium]